MTIEEARAILSAQRVVICMTTSSERATPEQIQARADEEEAERLIAEKFPCTTCRWSSKQLRLHPDARLPRIWLMCTNPKVRVQWHTLHEGMKSDDKFCYAERRIFSGGPNCGAAGLLWEK